jgi:xylose isomerase
MVEARTLSAPLAERYSGWSADLGTSILDGSESLDTLESRVISGEIDPTPVSGRQELLENRVNRAIWSSGA